MKNAKWVKVEGHPITTISTSKGGAIEKLWVRNDGSDEATLDRLALSFLPEYCLDVICKIRQEQWEENVNKTIIEKDSDGETVKFHPRRNFKTVTLKTVNYELEHIVIDKFVYLDSTGIYMINELTGRIVHHFKLEKENEDIRSRF